MPTASEPTQALFWSPVVVTLTANSTPRREPPESKRCPKMPRPSPSWSRLYHVTTKAKLPSAAAVATAWVPVVYVFTWKSPPTGAPEGAKRRPKMPFPSPSGPSQSTTKRPSSAMIAG